SLSAPPPNTVARSLLQLSADDSRPGCRRAVDADAGGRTRRRQRRTCRAAAGPIRSDRIRLLTIADAAGAGRLEHAAARPPLLRGDRLVPAAVRLRPSPES